MELTDTHCHIHESIITEAGYVGDDATRTLWAKAGNPDPTVLVRRAYEAQVTRLICVGCNLNDSKLAVAFAQTQPNVWASIGVHPHEARVHMDSSVQRAFTALVTQPKVVAIGECGLDYFYNHSPKAEQIEILQFQIELARAHNLPMIFHVRNAFEDFWPIFDKYPGIRGVIHSFSATEVELAQIIGRGLYVGLNGIMTFAKDPAQIAAAKAVPLEWMLLETDAPFLTPVPFRGTMCEPKHTRVTGEFLANLRGESLEVLAAATTKNAQKLFNLK